MGVPATLIVNGRAYPVEVPAERTLLTALRTISA
jgi:hypothetical protein